MPKPKHHLEFHLLSGVFKLSEMWAWACVAHCALGMHDIVYLYHTTASLMPIPRIHLVTLLTRKVLMLGVEYLHH